jgi:predicted phosphodiesterase
LINEGEYGTKDLAKKLGKSQPMIRKHIRELKKEGAPISSIKKGKKNVWKFFANYKPLEEIKTMARMINKVRSDIKYERKKVETNKKSEETGVLLLSDLHLGSYIENHGYLTYYPGAQLKMIDILYESFMNIIEDKRKGRNINTLHIAMLGDLVDGIKVYPGHSRQQATMTAKQQINGTKEKLLWLLEKLSKEFEQIYVYAVPGNHGRHRREEETADDENYDLDLYERLDDAIKAEGLKNVEMKYTKSDMIINIMGRDIYLTHGKFFPAHVQTPWKKGEAIGRIINLEEKMDKDYYIGEFLSEKSFGGEIDYVFLGHYHNKRVSTIFKDKGIFYNGSFEVGQSKFAKKLNVNSEPTQLYISFHSDWGVSSINPIKFPKIEDAFRISSKDYFERDKRLDLEETVQKWRKSLKKK